MKGSHDFHDRIAADIYSRISSGSCFTIAAVTR